jgi:gluconate 2-dehydrogenase
MIATSRRLVEGSKAVDQGLWKESFSNGFFGANVYGKTLGIMGMGRIGQAIARRAVGFRMPVLYYNRRRLDPSIEQDCKADYRSKEDLLRQADLIMLAMPFTPENYHLIGSVGNNWLPRDSTYSRKSLISIPGCWACRMRSLPLISRGLPRKLSEGSPAWPRTTSLPRLA